MGGLAFVRQPTKLLTNMETTHVVLSVDDLLVGGTSEDVVKVHRKKYDIKRDGYCERERWMEVSGQTH